MARRAMILPSTTAQDVEICRGFRIFDEHTSFVIYEKNPGDDFEKRLRARMSAIFGIDRVLSSFCDLRFRNVQYDFSGFSPGGLDFANYDTCNFYYDAPRWLSGHVPALKKNSPVFFTFDADYRGRSRLGMDLFPEASLSDRRMVEAGMEHFPEPGNAGVMGRMLENVARLVACVRSSGIHVEGVEIYKEPPAKATTMVFVSGVKR